MTALGTAHATKEDFLNQESRNRGNRISEVEGKAARVAASELGDERASCSPAFLIRNPLFPEKFVIARPRSSGRRGDRSSTCRILIRKKGKQEMRTQGKEGFLRSCFPY